MAILIRGIQEVLSRINKMRKKAQVSEFIIVGVILLIATGVFIYIRANLELPDQVPQDFLPVKTYVEGCTQQVTQEAVDLLGVQGGYIEIPDYIRYDPTSYVQEAGIGFRIPLWYYKGETRMPSKQDMEQDISRYIENNVLDCIDGFLPFEDQFVIEELSSPRAETTIADDKVIVLLKYDILLKDEVNDRTFELNEYIAKSTSNLGDVYDLARDILLTENEKGFLENITMDLIAVGDFPLEGMELACGKTWSKQQLKIQLANMLKYNLHYLRFEKTRNQPSGIDYFDSENTGYVQEASATSHRNIQVEPIFDTSYGRIMYGDPLGMNFEVYPSQGDKVTGIDMGMPIIDNCLQIYHHFYNIEYPILFRLTDYSNEDNPYTFNFATPVIVVNNQPSRTYDPTIIDTDLEAITSAQYCDTAKYELEVFAIDKVTQEELAGANISYECVGFRCDIGETEHPTFDGIKIARSLPALVEMFPPCTNGFVVAKKEGYMEAAVQHTIGEQMEHSVLLDMTPLRELDYRFVIRQGTKTRIMEENEKVFMTIESKELRYSETIYYPIGDSEYFGKLELPAEDTTYNVDIKLIRIEGEITEEEVITGGYESMNWSVTTEDVLNSNRVVFTIISQDPEPETIEDYVELYNSKILPSSGLYEPRLE